jgi:hypothetical protein
MILQVQNCTNLKNLRIINNPEAGSFLAGNGSMVTDK